MRKGTTISNKYLTAAVIIFIGVSLLILTMTTSILEIQIGIMRKLLEQ